MSRSYCHAMIRYLAVMLFVGLLNSISSAEDKFAVCSAPEPPKAADKCLDNLLKAFAETDYDAYTRDAEEAMKKSLSKGEFERATKATTALFGAIKSRTYLGSLKKQGYIVHLWKARFSSSEDDVLIKLSLTPDESRPQVGGFWLQ